MRKRALIRTTPPLQAAETWGSPSAQLPYQGQIWNYAAGPNYALSPDGKRFVVVGRGKESAEHNLNVVLNWTEELLRLAHGCAPAHVAVEGGEA